jgi:hypothetical protein
MTEQKNFKDLEQEIHARQDARKKTEDDAVARGKGWEKRIASIFREDLKSDVDETDEVFAENKNKLAAIFDPAAAGDADTEELLAAIAKIPQNEEYDEALTAAYTLIGEISEKLVAGSFHTHELTMLHNFARRYEHPDPALAALATAISAQTEAASNSLFASWEVEESAFVTKMRLLADAATDQYLRENPRAAQILRAMTDGLSQTADISARLTVPASEQDIRAVAQAVNGLYQWHHGTPPVIMGKGSPDSGSYFHIGWASLRDRLAALSQPQKPPAPPQP